jgi:hypothetical protein
MHQPSYYRSQAAKYVEQAQNAKSSKHRLLLLSKAETMVRLADQAELMQRIYQNRAPIETRSGTP